MKKLLDTLKTPLGQFLLTLAVGVLALLVIPRFAPRTAAITYLPGRDAPAVTAAMRERIVASSPSVQTSDRLRDATSLCLAVLMAQMGNGESMPLPPTIVRADDYRSPAGRFLVRVTRTPTVRVEVIALPIQPRSGFALLVRAPGDDPRNPTPEYDLFVYTEGIPNPLPAAFTPALDLNRQGWDSKPVIPGDTVDLNALETETKTLLRESHAQSAK